MHETMREGRRELATRRYHWNLARTGPAALPHLDPVGFCRLPVLIKQGFHLAFFYLVDTVSTTACGLTKDEESW
jgi:hypothetical protein